MTGASVHSDLPGIKLLDWVQAMEKSMLKIVDGSLLDSDCQYIAHQCNCHSLRGAGLASAIFKAFSWADVYSNRSDRGNDASLFGSITVHGDPKRNQRYVINIYGQLKPGKPSRGRDSATSRLEAFGKAIDQIAELPELKSIGFPYGIGCGLAGGDWNKYGRLLEDFAALLQKFTGHTRYCGKYRIIPTIECGQNIFCNRAQLSKARQLLSGPFQRNLKSVLVAMGVPPTVKVTLGDPSSVIVPAAESFAVRAVAIAEAFGVSRVK